MKSIEQFHRKVLFLKAASSKAKSERFHIHKELNDDLTRLCKLRQQCEELESLFSMMCNESAEGMFPMLEGKDNVPSRCLKSQLTSAIYYNLVACDLHSQYQLHNKLVDEANAAFRQTLHRVQICEEKLDNIEVATKALKKQKRRVFECFDSLSQEERLTFRETTGGEANRYE